MFTPRQIIDDIRKKEYGIGLPPNEEYQEVVAKLRAKVDRALKPLSKDLYAKSIHFVLELVQNAEDNNYASGVLPEIRFILNEKAILVQNNELGFAEENVRSLCDVAKSSKLKRLGYIGEKGIGFKSVFKVSDEPYISSNGYSFSLPIHDPLTNLGYIIPVWQEKIPAGIKPNWTNILLPLTQKGKLEAPKVANIQPSLLLFLKKLRRIEIHDATGTCTNQIYREGEGNSVQISSNAGTDHWRVVRRVLPVPTTVTEEKRVDVLSVEIVLAFPLVEDGTANSSFEHSVYSFLPIRSFGFRFAIQADFILSSSREDILSDVPWNQWLRDRIPPLFLEAVELFKSDDYLRANYLAFVPSAKTVTDAFFEKIPGTITDLLKETDCILTASDRWAKPSDVLLASESIRSLLSNEEVKKHLNKEFIEKDFQADLHLLTLLGVKGFIFTDLCVCLNDTKWLAAKEDEWLLRLYAHLSIYAGKEKLDVFRKMSLVPLENGCLESPTNGQIFFPLNKQTNYGFETGLRIVRKCLFKAGDSQTAEAARKFLRDSLGIRSPGSTEIINQHILPVFEDNNSKTNWKSKGEGFYIGAVEYIKNHLDQYVKEEGSLERLTKSLFIKYITAEGSWFRKASILYLPKEYDNANDLEAVYQGIEDINFVNPIYLTHSVTRLKAAEKNKPGRISIKQKRDLADSWKAFFVKIGVETVLRVTVSAGTSDPEKIESNDLAEVIKTKDANRLAHILRLLDSDWDRYRDLLFVEQFVMIRKKLYSSSPKPTAFLRLMLNSEWIPTQSHGLCKPSQVCIDCPENKELLGDNVPYLSVSITNEDLIANLDLQKEPSVSATLACLRELAGKPTVDIIKVHRLYDFLNKHFEKSSVAITKAFQDEALIYTPEGLMRFHSRSDVYWKDMSKLFGKKRGYLSKYWHDLQDFFIEKLHVRMTPDPEDYVALLKELSQTNSLDSNEVRKVWDIYLELEKNLKPGDNDDDPTEMTWWKDFVSSKLFWTDRDEFWHNEENVYINDDQEYYQLFKGKGDFAFLQLPENKYPSFSRLTNAANLQLLSRVVKVCEVRPHQPHPNPKLTSLLHGAAPFIVRYLYFKNNETYKELQESKSLAALNQTNVHNCDDLTVAYEFHGVRVEVNQNKAGTLGGVYLQSDIVNPGDHIGELLSNLLNNPSGINSFICLLLTKNNKEEMELLMETHKIPPMPVDSPHSLLATADFSDEASSEDGFIEDEPLDQGIHSSDQNISEFASFGGGKLEGKTRSETSQESSATKEDPSSNDPAEARGDGIVPEKRHTQFLSGSSASSTPAHDKKNREYEGKIFTPEKTREAWKNTIRSQLDRVDTSDERKGHLRHNSEGENEWTNSDRPGRNWFRVLGRPNESVESTNDSNPPPSDDEARLKVIEYEQRRSRFAIAAQPNQAGYDISSDDQFRGVTRRIEVKGLLQRWVGDATVAMTGPQFDASRCEPPQGIEYWLYVVDGLGTDSPRVHPILRPAAKVERIYLQAQDWLSEIDQADRDRLSDKASADLGIPIIEFDEIAKKIPNFTFLTRYLKGDLTDILPVGGFLKCQPLDSAQELPTKGKLVMMLNTQIPSTDKGQGVLIGEFRWGLRQSLEGEDLYVEVSFRPRAQEPGFRPVTIKVTMKDWPSFRPYAVCEALLET